MNDESIRDDRLRDEFAKISELAGDGKECPPPETLWSSGRAELDPVDNEPVILHLSECTACAAAWRIAQDLAEERLRERAPVSRKRLVVSRWASLAATAAVVLAVVSLVVFNTYERRTTPPIYRTQEVNWLQPVVPDGVSLPRDAFVLRWTGGPEGTTYDVRVTTASLDPVAGASRLDRSEFRVSEDALAGISSGAQVFWQVTAHLPDGRRLESASFAVKLE
jgi:hypothetical protein